MGDDAMESAKKTWEAKEILAAVGAYDDVEKAADSKKIRAGKGKARNRRYVLRRGPLVIYAKNDGVESSFRNLPGLELCCVDRLNLLQLAPGGHMGRFCIWTQGAITKLESIYGEDGKRLPAPVMNNADLARIINSDEVQSLCRSKKVTRKQYPPKRNAIKRIDALEALDAYAATARRSASRAAASKVKKADVVKAARAKKVVSKKYHQQGKTFYESTSKQGDVCSKGFNP